MAGIIDDIGIVEKIHEIFLIDSTEKIHTGEVVKSIILNGQCKKIVAAKY